MSQQHALLNVLSMLLGVVAYAAAALAIASGALKGLQWIADNLSKATKCGRILSDASLVISLVLVFTESLPWTYLLAVALLSWSLRSSQKSSSMMTLVQTVVLPLVAHVILTHHLSTHNASQSWPSSWSVDLLASGYHAVTGHPLPPKHSRSRGNHLLPGGRLDWDLPDTTGDTSDEYTLMQAMTLAILGIWSQTIWNWALLLVRWSIKTDVADGWQGWGRSLLPRVNRPSRAPQKQS